MTATAHSKVDIKRGEVVTEVAFWDGVEGSRVVEDMIVKREVTTVTCGQLIPF